MATARPDKNIELFERLAEFTHGYTVVKTKLRQSPDIVKPGSSGAVSSGNGKLDIREITLKNIDDAAQDSFVPDIAGTEGHSSQ